MPKQIVHITIRRNAASGRGPSLFSKVLANFKKQQIKALTALMGRLSLSVGLENGSERGHKTVSINPLCPVI